jgi:uncharacterized damage-inducible protein DinB
MSSADAVPEVHPAAAGPSLASSGGSLLSDEGSAPVLDAAAYKRTLHRYQQKHRDALLAKLDGLAERQARWPVTPTGTNVLGLVKHVAGVQAGYFGEVFGRPLPDPPAWLESEDGDDMYATLDETLDDIVAFHHRSAAHADATIEALDLDETGHVPWWPAGRNEVTLHHVLVRVIAETGQHAGHADIIRELIDGTAGLTADRPNLPSDEAAWWSAYRQRVEEAARAAAGLTKAPDAGM